MTGHGYRPGDRIEVVGLMVDDPAPMEIGARGTVTRVTEPLGGISGQLWVNWDNGRKLAVLVPEDLGVIRRIDGGRTATSGAAADSG